MIEFKRILPEIIKALDSLKKDGLIQGYALIGGMAVAVRGYPRSTKDLDFLINADEDFFRIEFTKTLKAKGYSVEVYKGDFTDPLRGMVRILGSNNAPLVDFILIHKKWQEDIIDSAEEISIGGISVPIAKAEDLVILKLKAGSPRDLLDVEELIKLISLSGVFDIPRLLSLAKRAGVDKKLKQFLKKFNIKESNLE